MTRTAEAVRELACAAGLGDLGLVRAILQKSPAAARDWRPIIEASYKGFAPVVEILIKNGADVNAISSSEHNRPLHRAIEKGHLDVVDVLLKGGADVEARATWLQIPSLAKAAFEGRSRIVERLLQQGAKVNRFSSAAIGKLATVKSGVDGENSLTTLHYCAGSALGLPSLLKVALRLLETGSDPNAIASKLGHKVTPIKLAARNRPVAELLMDHGADPNDVFRDVLLTGCNYEFADALLARGAELNPVMWKGQTLLHVTIHWGRLSSAQWLLEHGANPNTVGEKDKWTPLHQAASRGVASIVEALLKHGADPTKKDVHGKTPLDIARGKKRSAVVTLFT